MTLALRCRDLAVGYGTELVIEGLDLDVRTGETLAILGPSGSGKTTLLYAVAGLIPATDGSIEIGGILFGTEDPPETRSVGMVFQNYALWPHMSALQTVAYPYEQRGLERTEARRRAGELMERVGIGELADRLPDQLSGGQQQRVGVARALASEPQLYLFDEPTAHLDGAMRDVLQAELVDSRIRHSAAALYTTHDAAEAMAVGDRIAVMRDGKIAQIDRPEAVYARPADEWVARLTGPASVLAGTLASDGERLDVVIGGESMQVEGETTVPPGEGFSFVVRPDWASLGGPLRGVVERVRFEGPHTDYGLATSHGSVRVRQIGAPVLNPGDETDWSIDRVWVLGSQSESESDSKAG